MPATFMQNADAGLGVFGAMATITGLAIAAMTIVLSGTSRHKDKLEDAAAWNPLLNATVHAAVGWFLPTLSSLAFWLTEWMPLRPVTGALAIIAAGWGLRGLIWICAAVLRFRKPAAPSV